MLTETDRILQAQSTVDCVFITYITASNWRIDFLKKYFNLDLPFFSFFFFFCLSNLLRPFIEKTVLFTTCRYSKTTICPGYQSILISKNESNLVHIYRISTNALCFCLFYLMQLLYLSPSSFIVCFKNHPHFATQKGGVAM